MRQNQKCQPLLQCTRISITHFTLLTQTRSFAQKSCITMNLHLDQEMCSSACWPIKKTADSLRISVLSATPFLATIVDHRQAPVFHASSHPTLLPCCGTDNTHFVQLIPDPFTLPRFEDNLWFFIPNPIILPDDVGVFLLIILLMSHTYMLQHFLRKEKRENKNLQDCCTCDTRSESFKLIQKFTYDSMELTHLAPDQPLPFRYEIPGEGKKLCQAIMV